MSEIKVINRSNESLEIITESHNENEVVIYIDKNSNGVLLGNLNIGDHFKSKVGIEYIVCDKSTDEVAVCRNDVLDKAMIFGVTNNWAESNWRKYLNTEYLRELKNEFGTTNIVKHSVDLLSMDGYDDYGIVEDFISAMTFDRFRKYHKIIGDVDKSHILSTPDSTPSGWSDSLVRYVASSGRVYYCDCNWGVGKGVRPFFILKSNTKIYNL